MYPNLRGVLPSSIKVEHIGLGYTKLFLALIAATKYAHVEIRASMLK